MLHYAREFLLTLEGAFIGLPSPGPLTVDAAWSSRNRRAYKNAEQLGTGSGPFVDVIDHQWVGSVTATFPIVAIAFALTNGDLYWAKSRPSSVAIDVKVSATGYAHFTNDGFTIGLQLGGAGVPGLPVMTADPRAGLLSEVAAWRIGVPIPIYRAGDTELLALFLPDDWVRVGRNRLWALRDVFATGLPEPARLVFTCGRAGRIGAAVDLSGPA